MTPEVREAIDNARSCGLTGARKGWSPETVRAIAYAVASELPSEMTLGELTDELAIGSRQVAE